MSIKLYLYSKYLNKVEKCYILYIIIKYLTNIPNYVKPLKASFSISLIWFPPKDPSTYNYTN